jgi:hypothetical protein
MRRGWPIYLEDDEEEQTGRRRSEMWWCFGFRSIGTLWSYSCFELHCLVRQIWYKVVPTLVTQFSRLGLSFPPLQAYGFPSNCNEAALQSCSIMQRSYFLFRTIVSFMKSHTFALLFYSLCQYGTRVSRVSAKRGLSKTPIIQTKKDSRVATTTGLARILPSNIPRRPPSRIWHTPIHTIFFLKGLVQQVHWGYSTQGTQSTLQSIKAGLSKIHTAIIQNKAEYRLMQGCPKYLSLELKIQC